MPDDRKKIKVCVFDLDGTLWNGTLLEGDTLTLKSGVADVIRELDRRGILLSIASLNDGERAWIGLVLCEKTADALCIRLLLMSCRVMTRGIGSALLVHLTKLAAARGLALRADFQETSRNRIMYITYKLMGFEEIKREGDFCVLEYRGEERSYPHYLEISATEEQL